MSYQDGMKEMQEGEWLSFRPASGARIVFGGILLLLSLGTMTLFVLGKFHTPSGGIASPWAGLVPGLLLGLPALGLLSFRSGFRVHKAEQRIQHWWGFGKPFGVREESLNAFSHVEVLKEVRRQQNKTYVTYPVRLIGAEKRMSLVCRSEPLSARRLAERFARALDKPLHNHLSGIPVIRQPNELDLSLGERIAASGELPELPPQPADSKLHLQVDGERLQVEIPAVGILRGGLFLMVFFLPGLAMGIGFSFLMGGRTGSRFLLFGMGLFFLPLIGAALYAISRGVRRELLEVGPEEVRLRYLYPWGESSKAIPTQELEEITQSQSAQKLNPLGALLATGGISLIADRGMLTCGASLSREDRSFILDLVRYVLARSYAEGGGSKAKASPGQVSAGTAGMV
ncbi:MAG TPA: hypothetical protein ENK02_06765 [Planctomycetes bacterium]|nr:hypothetical protein [Planctomycetota bacterium]